MQVTLVSYTPNVEQVVCATRISCSPIKTFVILLEPIDIRARKLLRHLISASRLSLSEVASRTFSIKGILYITSHELAHHQLVVMPNIIKGLYSSTRWAMMLHPQSAYSHQLGFQIHSTELLLSESIPVHAVHQELTGNSNEIYD